MIPKDKLQHAAVGAGITLTAAITLFFFARDAAAATVGTLIGVWLTGVAAWVKEAWDRRHPEKRTFDGWAAFATVAGACAVALVSAVLLVIWG